MAKSPFLQKHSISIRIWHWLVFITIAFIISTVLFNSTMFKTRANVPMVKNVLSQKNVVVTDDQAFAVAHEYGDKFWILHKYLGFTLVFLFLSRVVIEISTSKEEKTGQKIKNALFMYKEGPANNTMKHYIAVRYSYLLFYLLVLFMAISGLIIAFHFGLSRETNRLIKEFHGYGQYFMYAFILFHLGGVILADIKHSRGLISGMVNGGE